MFYERFADLCEKGRISPSKLVVQLGMANSIATKWKKGSTPTTEALVKIADYFNCSVDFLLGRDNAVRISISNNKNSGDNIIGSSVEITKGVSGEQKEILDIYAGLTLEEKSQFLSFLLKLKK